MAKVIDKTRSSITRVTTHKYHNKEVIEMPEELLPARRYARRIKEEKDYGEHIKYRDQVFDEHDRSMTNANWSSSRAHSAQQSLRKTIDASHSVIEAYMKAEESFKQSMQERLNSLLSEE